MTFVAISAALATTTTIKAPKVERSRAAARANLDPGSLEPVAALLSQVTEDHTHVRSTEPRILALVDEGKARSETFRRLVAALDASDVIVYLEPKMTRQRLGGYLFHYVGGRGEWRYLRVAVDFHGAHDRVISLLAHELQHAVEVAQAPGARDAESLERLFSRRTIQSGCGGTATCYETRASQDVEYAVGNELKATP